MALTENVVLDIQSAQRQIDVLERQLNQLGTPVNVPVNVTGENSLDGVRRELARSENAAEGLNRELRGTDDELRRAERAADDTSDAMLRVGTRGVSAFSNLRGSIAGVAAGFVAFQGAQAFLDFAGRAIDAASDLEESTSKAQVVFGDFFDDIQAFSQTAPQALGLANAEALEFTGTFGNLFVALGLSQQAAADLAPDIVQLGADLASFNNLEVTDALDKLRAGLVGEAEPLRVLGVNLTAASTAAKAVELGLAASTTEVSEAAKVQARYAQILEQTTTAQGDFERTADGIANTQRTLTAEFQNLQAEVGQALLPLFAQLVASASDLVPKLRDMIPALAGAAEGFFSVVSPVLDLVGPLAELVALFGEVQSSAQFLQQQDDPFSQIGGSLVEAGTSGALPFALKTIEEIQTLFRTGFRAESLAAGIVEFNEAIAAGADPANRLTRFLQTLARGGTVTSDVLAQVVSGLDLTAAEAARIRIGAREGLFGDLSTEEIEAINNELDQFIDVGGRFEGRVTGMGRAAREAVPDVTGLEDPIREVTKALEFFEAPDFSSQFDALEAQFDALPDGLGAVADALRNEENEIITDFSAFLGNLEDELAARQAFADDIELLRALGLDDLADAFVQEGLEAAGALADAVANPDDAARAEALLDEFAARQAQSFLDTFRAELESSPLDLTIPLNVVGTIQSLQLEGLSGQEAALVTGAAGAGPNVGGGVTVNVEQNFDNTPGPTTETERAAQQINALINVE